MIELYCGCKVTKEGKFIVGSRCEKCKECNTISKLHPFGDKRFD